MGRAKLIKRTEKCPRCKSWETFYRQLYGVSKIWICGGCGNSEEAFNNDQYLPWRQ